LAFVGDPPLWRPYADEVHVSVTFTWDKREGKRLAYAWHRYYPQVKLGGPAITGSDGEFQPSLYVKPGITFTSRGCPRKCPWCLVPEWEGKTKLLQIKPGHIIQDNNILATPREHQGQVYEMLKEQRSGAVFSGGLDARLLDGWVAEQLKQLRISSVFLAADTDAALRPLEDAVKKLAFLGRNKLRCYVLCAFNGESMDAAERRLRAVWDLGCLPFAMVYQPPDRYIRYSQARRHFARLWMRPAAIRAMNNEGGE